MNSATINNHALAYEVQGQGPRVILETGLGAESAEWSKVEQLIAGVATVFRYDRLGRGESAPSQEPRDACAMVTELRILLDFAAVPPPYIFVGHSFGGLIGQIFAQRFRAEMSGLILIESVHPTQFEVLGPAFPASASDEDPSLTGMRAFWTQGWKNTESTKEQIDFISSFKQAPGPGALDRLPVRVLTTGSFLRIPFIPQAAREGLQSKWLDLQAQLLRLSSCGVQSLWPASNHFLQRENPNAVAAAVIDLINLT